MKQWRDPGLFNNDPIAEYFKSVTPPGYAALHYILDKLGIEPFLANKLLVTPLFLLTAALAYKLAYSVRPITAVAIAGSWLTCFFLSLIDQSLLSATPRAFAVPLLLWFLLSVSQNSRMANPGQILHMHQQKIFELEKQIIFILLTLKEQKLLKLITSGQ